MPLYEYRCGCGKQFTAFKKLADYREPQGCTCGAIAEKVISKPMVSVDYPAYQSPATGKWVEGRRQHEEDLRRSGCRLLEPGEQKDIDRKKKEVEMKFEASIDNSVERTFAELKG